jgi:hypothetical protein
MGPPAARRNRHSIQEDIFNIEASKSANTAITNGNLSTNESRKKRSVTIAEEAGPSKPSKRPKNAVAEVATPASSACKGLKPPPSDRKVNARIIAPIGEDKIMTIGGYSHSLAHLKKIMSQFCRPPVTHESTTISEVKSQQKVHESRKGATDKLAPPFASSAGDKASMNSAAAKEMTRHSLQDGIFDIEPSESAATAKQMAIYRRTRAERKDPLR